MNHQPSTAHPSTSGKPENWVTRYAAKIPKGQLLDLACGGGRHGRYFLELGYTVTFVDKDLSGVMDLATHHRATLVEQNLEDGSPLAFENNHYSGIIVVNYLHRPLLPALVTLLEQNGVLIYKTFARGNEQFGKPSNPDFLLHNNELMDVFSSDFTVVAFHQGKESNPNRITQAICAIKASNTKTT